MLPDATLPAVDIKVSADALASANPGVCAFRGVPTKTVRFEMTYSLPRPLSWVQRTVGLIGPLGVMVGLFVRTAAVRLPIDTSLERRLRRYELASRTTTLLAWFALFVSLPLLSPGLAALGLALFLVPVAVAFWRQRHWVGVGQVVDGIVALTRCHPHFVAALEHCEVQVTTLDAAEVVSR